VNGQGIMPSDACMGAQVICIVRDANQHHNETLCRIGKRSVDVDDDVAIYKSIKEESDRIKDFKVACARNKVKYDLGCDVEPMLDQPAFKCRPRNNLMSEFNNDLRQQEVEASSAASKYNKLVRDLMKYLKVLQEGLWELMKEEEEKKKASGERKTLSFGAWSAKAHRSVLETKHANPNYEWNKFFVEKHNEFKDERAEHWNSSLQKQIQVYNCLGRKVKSWPTQIKSMSEISSQRGPCKGPGARVGQLHGQL